MRLLQTLLFTTMILQASFARYRRPRPNMMGALQNILSSNAERPMVKIPPRSCCNTCNLPVQYSPPILPLPEAPCNAKPSLPQMPNLLPVQMPNAIPIPLSSQAQIQMQNPAQIQPNPAHIQIANPAQIQVPNPTQIQIPNSMPVQLQNPAQIQITGQTQIPLPNQQFQLPIPAQFPQQIPTPCQVQNPPYQLPIPAQIQLPNPTQIHVPQQTQIPMPNLTPMMPMPQLPEIVLEKPLVPTVCPCQREIIYPSPEITTNLFSSPAITGFSESVPLTPNQEIYGCPIPSPASLFNPSLPPASPVSAWTQENLPEATTGVRSQFLRKIPIPPPTL